MTEGLRVEHSTVEHKVCHCLCEGRNSADEEATFCVGLIGVESTNNTSYPKIIEKTVFEHRK